MARLSLRRSQALSPFGVGSMVDFPGQSLMSAGLEEWPEQPDCRIYDERLARRLGVKYFRAPPPGKQEGTSGAYLPFVRFPLWHFCPRCRAMKKAKWNDANPPRCDSTLTPRTGAPTCSTLPEAKRWRMLPIRFVVACELGHIEDFPWLSWAHSRRGQSLKDVEVCSSPLLRLNYTGKAGLMGLLVKCENCDAKARSLLGSAGPDSLDGLDCSGDRPWLGPHGTEVCESMRSPRMLQRGATNLYFPALASSILIPPFSDSIRIIIDDPDNWSFLTSGVDENGSPEEMRMTMFAEMKKIDFHRLKKVVTQKINGVGINETNTEEEYRYAEYVALLESTQENDEDFITFKPKMHEYDNEIQKYLEQIVLVEKLAETRVLTGFSRINPPTSNDVNDNKANLSLRAKPWLPGIRVYGEGIFFTLRKSLIHKWTTDAIRQRYEDIFLNHKRTNEKLGRETRFLTTKFFLLHTLAHILIRRLSFECGYGSSSLRERIYCSQEDEREMDGILIYTAAGDSEGTMGGLVEQGKPGRFENLINTALVDAMWCSTDPLCIESHGQGTDSLNRAACHACALLPETSCEEGNRFLDRVALIGTPNNQSLGFFGESIDRMMSG